MVELNLAPFGGQQSLEIETGTGKVKVTCCPCICPDMKEGWHSVQLFGHRPGNVYHCSVVDQVLQIEMRLVTCCTHLDIALDG